MGDGVRDSDEVGVGDGVRVVEGMGVVEGVEEEEAGCSPRWASVVTRSLPSCSRLCVSSWPVKWSAIGKASRDACCGAASTAGVADVAAGVEMRDPTCFTGDSVPVL